MNMTAKEAIKRIEDHMRVHKIGEPPHFFLKHALDMAIHALEQPSAPVWTPCSAGLPEEDGEYWVTACYYGGRFIGEKRYDAQSKKWDSDLYVIAWMPKLKPAPYQGEK